MYSRTVSMTVLLSHVKLFSICHIHLWVSPLWRVWVLRWWCCCCWEPAPAELAGLWLADRGRRRAALTATEPAAEGHPSLMSWWAHRNEPEEKTYSAWCAESSQHWRLAEVQEKSLRMISFSWLRWFFSLNWTMLRNTESRWRKQVTAVWEKDLRYSWCSGSLVPVFYQVFQFLKRSSEHKG